MSLGEMIGCICYIYLRVKDNKRVLVYWYYTEFGDQYLDFLRDWKKITWPTTLGNVLDHMDSVYGSHYKFSTTADIVIHLTLDPIDPIQNIDIMEDMKYIDLFYSISHEGERTGEGGNCYMRRNPDFQLVPSEWRDIRVTWEDSGCHCRSKIVSVTSDALISESTIRKWGVVKSYNVKTRLRVYKVKGDDREDSEEILMDNDEILLDGYIEADKFKMKIMYEIDVEFDDKRDTDDFMLDYKRGKVPLL